ncbi:hypothetical protein F383_13035 [Gossypium arboreum]|uniref:Uncharacterized protein n=1 Tax=Gossypium arboreum TaxID=29729 RepID=A0A0B0MGW9_GOSAR|nr:hypothetical protein F383_13035 [Gossypium arboreum]
MIKSTKQNLTLIFSAMKGIYVFTSFQFVPNGQKPWWLSSISLLCLQLISRQVIPPHNSKKWVTKRKRLSCSFVLSRLLEPVSSM